ncbi:MAG: ZIP family metal transporter [Cyanobium sp.]
MAELSSLAWILVGGLLMSLVAMVGGLTLLLPPRTLQRLLMPLLSLAAGMGAIGARAGSAYVAAGFSAFLALELFLQWHHSHRTSASSSEPLAILILLGDALHNFIGGLGIASTFVLNPAAGVAAWCAALAHELPQELGDFAILLHIGWSAGAALRWNLLSALTFPLGGVLAWLLAQSLSVAGLALFAGGNFLYIAASDLVPEIKTSTSLRSGGLRFGWFSAGLLLMLLLAR